MNDIVLDASVAVKLVIPEEFSRQAAALIEDSRNAGQRVVGPPLLVGEATNAVLQRFRRGDLTTGEAEIAVHDILSLAIIVTLPPGLIEEGFRFARDHELPTVYDSFYVVLARVLNAELWTDDRRLLRLIRDTAPWVRWIGDYPLTAGQA